jgi:hypothetical protein
MATTITVNTTTSVQSLNVAAGNILYACTGPTGTTFANQTATPGSAVSFTLAGNAALPAGTYTVTATSLDTAGNPAAFGSDVYPSVSGTVTVAAAITGPVVTTITLTAA